jgi:acyl dehydratase
MDCNAFDVASPTGELKVGERLVGSGWLRITQELIDGFGEYTLDPDPLHVDPAWARANSPYGVPIAFGFQTIALLTRLLYEAQGARARDTAADPSTHGHYLNYGFNRIRLVEPVLVESELRGSFQVAGRRVDDRGRLQLTFDATVEIRGNDRPALVADWLVIWVPAASQ